MNEKPDYARVRQTIQHYLSNLPDCNVVFAVESGSRAWGMESEDSDYDIRFVYASPIRDYLRTRKPPTDMKICLDENFLRCSQEDAFLDMVSR